MGKYLISIYILIFCINSYAVQLKSQATRVSVIPQPSPGTSVLAVTAAQMNSGEWRELSTIKFDGGKTLEPSGGGYTFIEFTDEGLYDPTTKRIYFVGCARRTNVSVDPNLYTCANTGDTNSRFVYYNEQNNTWSDMPTAPINTSHHAYDHAAINPANGDYFFRQENNVIKKYSNGTWSTLPSVNIGANPTCCTGLEYFPDIKSLVYIEPITHQIFTFADGASQWVSQNVSIANTYESFSEYSPQQKLLYFGGGKEAPNSLYSYDANKTVKPLPNSPVTMGQSSVVQTINPQNGNLLVISKSGSVHEFDLASNSWKQKGNHPLKPYYSDFWAAAASIPSAKVIFLVNYTGSNSSKVYLYKP